MLGDQNDMLFRLKQVLPSQWFPDSTPVLDTILAGLAWAWAWSYQLLQTAKAQARMATAQGVWLDLIAQDYFGPLLQRRHGECDTDYSVRIRSELVRERGTRKAVVAAISDLTGLSPVVFEPADPSDTGGYGGAHGTGGGLGYGVAGGWGSLSLPLQFFITAFRPVNGGVASVSGWNCSGGGYGEGSVEYATLSIIQSPCTDNDIYAAITRVLPIGTIAWTKISS